MKKGKGLFIVSADSIEDTKELLTQKLKTLKASPNSQTEDVKFQISQIEEYIEKLDMFGEDVHKAEEALAFLDNILKTP